MVQFNTPRVFGRWYRRLLAPLLQAGHVACLPSSCARPGVVARSVHSETDGGDASAQLPMLVGDDQTSLLECAGACALEHEARTDVEQATQYGTPPLDFKSAPVETPHCMPMHRRTEERRHMWAPSARGGLPALFELQSA